MRFDVLFRVDADQKIGIGHMRRCQALIEGFRRAGLRRFAFVTRTPQTFQEWFGKKYVLYPLKAKNFRGEIPELKRLFGRVNVSLMIVDRYGISTGYLSQICNLHPRVVSLNDDVMLKDYPVRAIVNYNVYAKRLKYPSSTQAKFFLGLRYAPIREEFRRSSKRTTRSCLPRVFVALGGYARAQYLEKVRAALEKTGLPMEVTWASGMTRDMASVMRGADLAISAAGVTTYELAALGIPSILLILAENQRRVAYAWQERGCVRVLGNLKEVSQMKLSKAVRNILMSRSKLKAMGQKARLAVDGQGGERLARELIQYFGGLKS